MVFGLSLVIYPGYGGSNDLRMSLQDYWEFANWLRQDDFDNRMLIKFKNLYQVNVLNSTAILIKSLIPAYLGTRFLAGPLNRGHANYKLYFPIFTSIYLLTTWVWTYKETPRRLYTELFTEESSQGATLRRTLRDDKPNLWRHLSAQLNCRGYKFEEMNEVNNTEFPTALMK